MEVAVVGNDDFITGFQLAGVQKTIVAETAEELEKAINEVCDDKEIGILVLEAEDVEKLPHRTRKKLDKLITPVIVTLSSRGKETDLREAIKRTVGVDLWK